MNDAQLIALVAAIAAPAVELLYLAGEHFGIWDRLTGRLYALEGLRRLKSGSGYPVSWIYDDEQDKRVFDALRKRIAPRVRKETLKRAMAEGHRVTLITVGGSPVVLTGLPPDWTAEEQRVYLSEHPIMFIFGVSREGDRQKGKADRACSIGDVERWLESERTNRQFLVGSVVMFLIAVAVAAVSVLLADAAPSG